MLELKGRHIAILEEIEVERFVKETVSYMIELNADNPYPKDQVDYETFVRTGINEAYEYELEAEQHVFAFLLAWHVLGESILQNKELVGFIKSKEMFPEAKDEVLMEVVYKELDKQEEENNGD